MGVKSVSARESSAVSHAVGEHLGEKRVATGGVVGDYRVARGVDKYCHLMEVGEKEGVVIDRLLKPSLRRQSRRVERHGAVHNGFRLPAPVEQHMKRFRFQPHGEVIEARLSD